MLFEDLLLREQGYHPSVNADPILQDLVCLRQDEHYVEGGEGDLIPPLAVGFHKVKPNILALAEEDGGIIIYDTNKSELYALKSDWLAHKNAIFDLDWVPGCDELVTASGDQTVALWDVETETCKAMFRGHSSSVKTVRFHENEPFVFASGARDGSIMLWDTRVNARNDFWEPINTLRNGHLPPPVSSSSSQPRSAHKRRRADPSNANTTVDVSQQSVTSVIFREPYQLISASSVDGSVKIWDTRKTYTSNKNPIAWHTFPFSGTSTRTHGFASLLLDPSKTRLFASCMDHTIYQYDCAAFTQKPVACYRGHQMATFYIKLSMSPCGTYLLSGSSDNLAYVWNTRRVPGSSSAPPSLSSLPEAAPLTLSGHQGEVSDVAWCPGEGLRVVTSSDDGTVRVWRVLRDEACPQEQIGRVVGRAQWAKKNVGTSISRRHRVSTAPVSSPASNLLMSPIKGTTLPPISPPKVSPAVQQSLLNMPSSRRPTPSLLSWVNKPSPSPLHSPTYQSPFKALPFQSPFKSPPFQSPRKLIITPKKTPPEECLSGIKALQDSTSKVQNMERAQGVKRKLCDIASPPSGSGCAKKMCFESYQSKSDTNASARKSLFGGTRQKKSPSKQTVSSSSRTPRKSPGLQNCTPQKLKILISDSPRRSPRSRIFQSPTVDLPNYVFDPQPRTPVGRVAEEKVRTPDWLTQIGNNRRGDIVKEEGENSPRGSPRTPRVARKGSVESPQTPRRPRIAVATTPTSSRRQTTTPRTAPKRLVSMASPSNAKTPRQQRGPGSILQYFSPQPGK